MDKELTFKEIPEEVRKMYKITKDEEGIQISHPNFIGLDNFHIREGVVTITIFNNHAAISLWKDVCLTHTTIF